MSLAFFLGRLFLALTAAALSALLLAVLPLVWAKLSRYRHWLARQLGFLRSSVKPEVVIGAQGVLFLGAVCSVVWQSWLVAVVSLLGAIAAPFFISRERRKRVSQVEQQVESWLSSLQNALHATPALGEALSASAEMLNEPIKSEVELMLREVSLGSPLDGALQIMADRVGSDTFRAATLVLVTARRTGGDLPRSLANTASSLREMARLEGVVRTKTAEGKAQAFVIGVIPVPLYLAVRWIEPEFFRPLEVSLSGHLVFGAAVLLWVLAVVSARKILVVDI